MIESLEFINENHPWFFAGLVAVFGGLVGSFLNVCIYRIPEERSIVFPGSTCACGKPIPFYHNIPVVSWLILRGKAHCCGQKFSFRYPAIELLTSILFLWVWLIYPPVEAMIGMLFVSFLICATFIDLDHMIIPDRFSIGGMIIGVVLSIFFPSLHGVDGPAVVSNIHSGLIAMTGALVGAGLVYWISTLGEIAFRKPAMGEGDIKFVGFIGAFCGWQGAFFAMFGGALVGTAFLLPCMLIDRLFGLSAKRAGDKLLAAEAASSEKSFSDEDEEEVDRGVGFGLHVPFGPMLAVAGLVYFLGFSQFVDDYFSNFYTLLLAQ